MDKQADPTSPSAVINTIAVAICPEVGPALAHEMPIALTMATRAYEALGRAGYRVVKV